MPPQDFPYLWRTGGDRVPEPEAPREGPDDAILGVQFNTCIDAFTKDNGGTRFKLGSHRLNVGPPREWNGDPEKGGRAGAGGGQVGKGQQPYDGEEAQTVECPAGSVILCNFPP